MFNQKTKSDISSDAPVQPSGASIIAAGTTLKAISAATAISVSTAHFRAISIPPQSGDRRQWSGGRRYLRPAGRHHGKDQWHYQSKRTAPAERRKHNYRQHLRFETADRNQRQFQRSMSHEQRCRFQPVKGNTINESEEAEKSVVTETTFSLNKWGKYVPGFPTNSNHLRCYHIIFLIVPLDFLMEHETRG